MFDNKIDKGILDTYYIIPSSCFIQETRDFSKNIFDDKLCNLCGFKETKCLCFKHAVILPLKSKLND